MLITQLSEVSKSFGTHDILHKVHWQIREGTRIALVGRNGAGKTTLFRLLTGETEPESGTVWRRTGAVIAAMEQEVRVDDRRTLREEAARGLAHLEELHAEFAVVTRDLGGLDEGDPRMPELLERYAHLQERLESEGGYSFEARVQAVLEGLHFHEADLDRPLAEFSGGQKSRAALARVLLRDPDLLLLDEPTNHLDLDAIEWLETFLANYRGAYIIISHDRMFLNRLAREVAEIRRMKLHHFQGNYDGFLAERERRLLEEEKRFEMQRAEILRQEDFIRRNIAGQKTKQAQSRRKMLGKLERLEAPEWPVSSIRMQLPEAERTARNVIEAKRLSKSYGDLSVFKDLSFLLLRGQKVGLIGPNGVGKSTLVRILVGEESQSSGHLRVGTGVQIGYFEQEQLQIRGSHSVLEEVWKVTPQVTEGEMRNFLGSFMFRGDEVYKSLNQLSGGEKSRVALAKLVREGSNFLVMDEPTNHLDIESREVFEAALDAFMGTVLVVSHDRYFLDRVVDHILELDFGSCRTWEGGYSRYAHQRRGEGVVADAGGANRPDRPGAGAPKAASRSRDQEDGSGVAGGSGDAAKEERRRSYDEQKRRKREEEKLRRQVAQAEARISELDGLRETLMLEMADPVVATDAGRLAELNGRLQEAEADTVRAIEKWESSSQELEAYLADSN